MARAEHFPDVAEARPHGNRAHVRRKLSPMAYVELGQDNGGILLNLSEGGFAVQSALALTSREFRELRFQVPALQGWLTASGRIVWLSDSKKEAGIQFTELSGEARREIHKWVLADGTPEKANERIPAPRPAVSAGPPKDKEESRQQIPGTPYRGGGTHEPAVVHNAPINAAQPEREPERQTVGIAVAEPPPQEFHFTDYSMFAPVPEREAEWSLPAGRRGNWRRAGLGILAAVLFFALGATVGRGTIDRWIADLGGWTQSRMLTAPAPKVTPPGPPAHDPGIAEFDANPETQSAATDEEQTKAEKSGNLASGPAVGSDSLRSANKEEAAGAAESAGTVSGSPREGGTEGSAARSTIAPRASEPRARHSTESAVARGDYGIEGEPSKTATEHSILVNAPEPGSQPFFVNFPGEAVSASGAIAISARRTIEILPRSSAAASGSQRVVIGRLISHSEPFYPAEARKRRIEGSVEVQARVGRTGQVIGVTPVSGPWLLFPAAVNAVREWRYEPTFVNGDPAETIAEITIVFRLP